MCSLVHGIPRAPPDAGPRLHHVIDIVRQQRHTHDATTKTFVTLSTVAPAKNPTTDIVNLFRQQFRHKHHHQNFFRYHMYIVLTSNSARANATTKLLLHQP